MRSAYQTAFLEHPRLQLEFFRGLEFMTDGRELSDKIIHDGLNLMSYDHLLRCHINGKDSFVVAPVLD